MVDVLSLLSRVKEPITDAHAALFALFHALMIDNSFRPAHQPLGEQEETLWLPESVFAAHPDAFSIEYRHLQSSMRFICKGLVLADRLIIHALPAEDTRNVHGLELLVTDHVVSPLPSSLRDAFKDIPTLATRVQRDILQKLVPIPSKDGYEQQSSAPAERQQSQQNSSSSGTSARPPPRNSPPERPPMHDPLMDPRYGGFRPAVPFGGVGSQDLYPPGMYPAGGLGRPGRYPGAPDFGGGMHVGPRHPSFGNPFSGDPMGGDPFGMGQRGLGRFPQGLPPGARFDPPGPYGMQGPRPGHTGPRNPRSFPEPEPDHMRPPGTPPDDMYS